MGIVCPSVRDHERGSQRRESLEVSRVVKKNWSGLLGSGLLIILAIASASCSGQTSNTAALPASETITRSITVYESPT
jgi:hypothetical protein